MISATGPPALTARCEIVTSHAVHCVTLGKVVATGSNHVTLKHNS